MLIAHFSDPHLFYFRHAWRSLPNRKQFLGLVNWLLRRRLVHQRRRLPRAVDLILSAKPDVVLVTGDICQLAYPEDYAAFARFMQPISRAGIPALILSGNHDFYSSSSRTREAFAALQKDLSLGHWGKDGLAEVAGVEFLPLDAAVPTPSFQCWGNLSDELLGNVRKAAEARACSRADLDRAPLRIAFGHFPLLGSTGQPLPEKMALRNAAHVLELLPRLGVSNYLCGHIHKPFALTLPGGVRQYCSGALTAGGVLRFFQTAQNEDGSPVLHEKSTHHFD